MLFIYGTKLSALDKTHLKKIFSFAGIEESHIRFVDTEYEDLDVANRRCFVAVGKNAVRLLARALIENGFFKTSDFFGNDLLDTANKFFFYNVGMEVSEIMSSQENKDFVWSKVQMLAKDYLEWNHDVSPLGAEESGEENVTPDASSNGATIVETALVEKIEAKNVQPISSIELSVLEMLNALYEHVSITDPSLGKSLAKYEKFSLSTSSGVLDVYPTSRIPESDRDAFSFRDLIVLLRSAVFLGSDTIVMEKASGNSVR